MNPHCPTKGVSGFLLAKDVFDMYRGRQKEIAKRVDLPLAALDILLLLGRNPEVRTAADVIRLRGYKANLVSMHVDRLVQRGFVRRVLDPEDRRRVLLELGPEAGPVVEEGQALTARFHERLLEGVSEEQLEACRGVMELVRENMRRMKENGFG